MKLLTAKEIKKIVIGVVLSDGYVDVKNSRFDLYSKHREYVEYISSVLSQISGMHVSVKVKKDKRGYVGYRLITRSHPYLKNIGEKFYGDKGRKELNGYIVNRVDVEALAHIWMCDGYLEHSKNRKKDSVQNIGWFCLEAFPEEELGIFQKHLKDSFGISSSLVKKPWGFGYRIRVGGEDLQRLISTVYPYILDCFKHKTSLYYKTTKSANMDLPSAEQYIQTYECVEDIVRHSQQ